jgi:hypothetical protein
VAAQLLYLLANHLQALSWLGCRHKEWCSLSWLAELGKLVPQPHSPVPLPIAGDFVCCSPCWSARCPQMAAHQKVQHKLELQVASQPHPEGALRMGTLAYCLWLSLGC